MRIFILLSALTGCFCLAQDAFAFLPPQFFVQGLSSLWTVIAAGVAVVVIPFVMSMHFLKNFFKNYRKFFLLFFIYNIAIAAALGIFFYFKFYKPLYEDSYLFSPKGSTEGVKEERPSDPSTPNKKYRIIDEMLRDDEEGSDDAGYGLTPLQVGEKIKEGVKVYFVDTREIEEFNAGHISGAKQIRHKDLDTEDKLLSVFSLSRDELGRSFFVLYCHNGDRALFTASKFNNEHIKYLIGGVEGLYGSDTLNYTGSVVSDKAIFGKKYQYRFQSTAKEAASIMKKKPFVIVDMRRPLDYGLRHIKGSISFPINVLPEEKYGRILSDILKCKGREFILIADRYSELFYANLMILRLTRDHGFDEGKFHIVFYQLDDFKSDSSIVWEGSFYNRLSQ